jgi:hypothetical protein
MYLPPAKLILCLLLWAQEAWAVDTLREQEIAQCLPGEISTWGDGIDRHALSSPLKLVYKHVGAPPWFNELQVLGAIQNAAMAWSSCGVPSQVSAWFAGQDFRQGEVLVQWSDAGSRQNFGLANLGERTLSLGPAAFQLLQARNPTFNSRETLQMVVAHEMGHLYGVMAHSRRCVDVTSYYTNGQGGHCTIRNDRPLPPGVEYRSVLPTACDIARCRAANGKTTFGSKYMPN